MKLAEPPTDVIATGNFPESELWRKCCHDVERAIASVVWPPGTDKFILNPESLVRKDGKVDNHPNGVKPIKLPAIRSLVDDGWVAESLPPIKSTALGTGDLDALYNDSGVYVGFEWETGNISSSHRAINKLVLGLIQGGIRGGILVVPGNTMKKLITDRVGNISELKPYFELWSAANVVDGALRIYAVEHDGVSSDVPHVPKGGDGRAVY